MKVDPIALLFVALVAAVGLTSVNFYKAGDSTSSPDPIRLTGVLASNEVVVSAKVDGRIEQLNVQEGSWVQVGDLIAMLDRVEIEAEKKNQLAKISQLKAKLNQNEELVTLERDRARRRTERAVAELQVARGQREQTVAELEQLRKNAQRTVELMEEGLVPRQEYELVDTAVRVAEARLRSSQDQVLAAQAELDLIRVNEGQVNIVIQDVEQSRAQLRQAEAQLTQVMARLSYTEVKAPLSGMVSLRVVRQGEVIRSSAPIVTIVDLDDVWVRAAVEESYISQIVVGQPLTVQLASGEELQGKVTFISPEAGFATQRDVSREKRDIRTFGIKVALPNPERRLHPGMTAYVLLPDKHSSALAGYQSWARAD